MHNQYFVLYIYCFEHKVTKSVNRHLSNKVSIDVIPLGRGGFVAYVSQMVRKVPLQRTRWSGQPMKQTSSGDYNSTEMIG